MTTHVTRMLAAHRRSPSKRRVAAPSSWSAVTRVWSGHESFFFFSSRRRHTRFDCDWSSDVCSSDLANPERLAKGDAIRFHADVRGAIAAGDAAAALNGIAADISGAADFILSRGGLARSEERRGGEECRSRWAPDHLKKKRK